MADSALATTAINNLEMWFMKLDADLDDITHKLDQEYARKCEDAGLDGDASPFLALQRLRAVKDAIISLNEEDAAIRASKQDMINRVCLQLLNNQLEVEKYAAQAGLQNDEQKLENAFNLIEPIVNAVTSSTLPCQTTLAKNTSPEPANRPMEEEVNKTDKENTNSGKIRKGKQQPITKRNNKATEFSRS